MLSVVLFALGAFALAGALVAIGHFGRHHEEVRFRNADSLYSGVPLGWSPYDFGKETWEE